MMNLSRVGRLLLLLLIRLSIEERCNWNNIEESNIVEMTVEEGFHVGEGFGLACEEAKVSDCDQILAGVLMRHPHVSLAEKAPYRVKMLIQQPWQESCHRLTLSDMTLGTEREVIYDAQDNAESLALSSCERINAPHCTDSVAERIRQVQASFVCPAARSRRAAANGHPCAGPWQPTAIPTQPTEAKCIHTLALDNSSSTHNATACLFERLLIRDGKWYRLVFDQDDNLSWPQHQIMLGTRQESSPLLEVQRISTDELRKEPLLTLPENILYTLIARWDPFDRGQGHGHTLHDLAFSLLWALFSLGVWTPDPMQIILLDDHLALPSDIWLATLSSRPPFYKHDLASMLCPPHHYCLLPRALAGIGHRSYFALHLNDSPSPDPAHLKLFGRVTAGFARFAAANMRTAFPHEAFTPNSNQIQVLIVQRLHSRIITNADEIASTLSEKAHFNVSVLALDFLMPQDQLSAFASAHLIIAVEGGALDLLLLTETTKAIVVIGRNPLIPWPEGCSGCGPQEQFTHANFFEATSAWLASVRVPCCGPLSSYTPDPYDILAASRIALEKKRRLDGAAAY